MIVRKAFCRANVTSLECQPPPPTPHITTARITHESHFSSIPKSFGGDWSRSFAGIMVTGWNPGCALASKLVMIGGVRM